jgi:hypothetical protein
VIEGVSPVELAPTDPFGSLTPAAAAMVPTAELTPPPDQPAPAAEAAPTGAPAEDAFAKVVADAQALVARCRQSMSSMHAEDQEEAIDLIEEVENTIANKDAEGLSAAGKALGEFLFFVEGR